jgi:hypothetical protein
LEPEPLVGRTRWRRFGAVFVPVIGLVGLGLFMISTGAIAAPVSISGTVFTVTADSLNSGGPEPQEFIQTSNVDMVGSTPTPVTTTIFKNATIANLSQTVCVPTGLPGGAANLKVALNAGKATASNLVVDGTTLNASSLTLTNFQLGVPYANPRTGTAQPSQTAEQAQISGLNQSALSLSAGTFALSGVRQSGSFTEKC